MKIQTDKGAIQADTRRPLIQVENSGKVIPSQAGSFFSSHSGFRLTAPNRSINITFFWPHSERTSCIFLSPFLLLFLLYSAAVQTCLQFVWRPVCILSVLLSSSVCNHCLIGNCLHMSSLDMVFESWFWLFGTKTFVQFDQTLVLIKDSCLADECVPLFAQLLCSLLWVSAIQYVKYEQSPRMAVVSLKVAKHTHVGQYIWKHIESTCMYFEY